MDKISQWLSTLEENVWHILTDERKDGTQVLASVRVCESSSHSFFKERSASSVKLPDLRVRCEGYLQADCLLFRECCEFRSVPRDPVLLRSVLSEMVSKTRTTLAERAPCATMLKIGRCGGRSYGGRFRGRCICPSCARKELHLQRWTRRRALRKLGWVSQTKVRLPLRFDRLKHYETRAIRDALRLQRVLPQTRGKLTLVLTLVLYEYYEKCN